MTKEELSSRLANPRSGSKLRAAQVYGLDLTLYERTLLMTPEERLRELQSAQPFFDELRRHAPVRSLAGRDSGR
jgi:hypothetical protein